MKRDERNIEEVLERSLPSASTERMESARERILNYVQSDAAAERNAGDIADFKSVRSFGWHRLAAMTAVAALVATAVWIGLEWQSRGVYARLETADGSLSQVAEGRVIPLQAGERIEAQQIVRSGSEGSTFLLADGSRVEMRAQSELVLERADDGVRIRLNSGDVIVNAAKQHGHLYVQTKDVTVSVVGTVFLVKAEESGSRVAVIEGEVRVQQDGIEKKLRPGEQVTTNQLMESQIVNEEISWSKNAATHIALLQQSSRGITEPLEAFEVASIRPTNSPAGGGGRGGPGGAPPACGGSPPTIDPGRFVITNATLYRLITMAYGKDCSSVEVSEFELLSGGPEWIRSDKFDIEAVIPKGSPSYTRRQLSIGNAPKLQMMIQTLLAARFKLTLRRNIKEMSVYLLTLGKGAPKLTEWKDADGTAYTVNTGLNPNGQVSTAIGGRKLSMADLAQQLGLIARRPVLDRTGITGEFTYAFEFAPSDDQPGVREMRANGRFPFLSGPSLFTVLEEELGLKLETSKAPVEVLVIEHAEKPSEN
jgi:uncharacterized protein (TIGR03435 family)